MDKKIQHAVFVHSLLQEALSEKGTGGKITSKLKSLASRSHIHPYKGEITISLSTLWRYLRLLKEHGIDGLGRKERSDKGGTRKINNQAIELAIGLRKDNPYRTTEVLLKIIEDEYGITGIKPATLNYHLQHKGFSRKQLRGLPVKVHKRFESQSANDLWIGDYHDKTDLLPLNSGKFAYLSAFIDCNSRYIVHGQYYLKENIQTLEDSFKKAVLKYGLPKRVYVDNAKIYRSHRFAYACAKLGIKLIFSKAYVKESRGKIEKFFRYVKENFEVEVIHRGGYEQIEQLNASFWAWLELDYQTKKHKEINSLPKERYKSNLKKKVADIGCLSDLFMLEATRKVNKKTCRVSIMGKEFQSEGFLGGLSIVVHYNPNDLSYILVYYKGRFIHKAFQAKINADPGQIPTGPKASGNLNYDYLQALEGKYQEHLGKNLLPAEFAENKQEAPGYHYQAFKKDIKEFVKSNKKLSDRDNDRCRLFYHSYFPLERETALKAIANAKDKYGDGYAIDVYLDEIKLFILNERSKQL